MALMTFELPHGIKGTTEEGETLLYREVGLRELNAGDIIDAQLEAEQVIVKNGQVLSYVSDVMMGIGLLRRQVEFVGEIKGPLSLSQIKRLHVEDLNTLQTKGRELDMALNKDLAERGRS
ncbi:phage tail assembly protein [Aeromonas caviae]|uniref:phage tail assembly protein n=1 Tax=Aeromonas caviae TaxID=648 RepID=UPI0029D856C1|nr:phage tail assembly protein [Aeromonas caviae]MDX7810934.1 phage tail assembly protein [Aeromonas caviae]